MNKGGNICKIFTIFISFEALYILIYSLLFQVKAQSIKGAENA